MRCDALSGRAAGVPEARAGEPSSVAARDRRDDGFERVLGATAAQRRAPRAKPNDDRDGDGDEAPTGATLAKARRDEREAAPRTEKRVDPMVLIAALFDVGRANDPVVPSGGGEVAPTTTTEPAQPTPAPPTAATPAPVASAPPDAPDALAPGAPHAVAPAPAAERKDGGNGDGDGAAPSLSPPVERLEAEPAMRPPVAPADIAELVAAATRAVAPPPAVEAPQAATDAAPAPATRAMEGAAPDDGAPVDGRLGSERAEIRVGRGDDAVALRVSTVGHRVRVEAMAATPELARSLVEHRAELDRALGDAGLSLSSFASHTDGERRRAPHDDPPRPLPSDGAAPARPSTTAPERSTHAHRRFA